MRRCGGANVADASASAAAAWAARGASMGEPGIGAVGEVGLLAELAAGLQVLLVGFLVVEIAGRLLAQH